MNLITGGVLMVEELGTCFYTKVINYLTQRFLEFGKEVWPAMVDSWESLFHALVSRKV